VSVFVGKADFSIANTPREKQISQSRTRNRFRSTLCPSSEARIVRVPLVSKHFAARIKQAQRMNGSLPLLMNFYWNAFAAKFAAQIPGTFTQLRRDRCDVI
jgi:hypothetical protein